MNCGQLRACAKALLTQRSYATTSASLWRSGGHGEETAVSQRGLRRTVPVHDIREKTVLFPTFIDQRGTTNGLAAG
ncbi:hypothetical protein SKAU_G00405190 [Synaphobranchus kaupii]|uniref:Uncharacterized protein n=1 Tax=Synaphobranchus kaupii TaxID=118154 RepID=A0A9Q1E9W2_SYNKA|nr:hypothetical protein SKAU_G00405190 [Synaphobranchus kaupii]